MRAFALRYDRGRVMSVGVSEFITKFSTRVQVSPVTFGHGWFISILTSDGTDLDPVEFDGFVLSISDARDLAVALYHATCAVEEDGA